MEVNISEELKNTIVEFYDRGFREGGNTMLESLASCLSDWKFNLLFRIAPKWTIEGLIERDVSNLSEYTSKDSF